MIDGFGRSFHYLRLSVDEACNYRCVYCLPNGYRKSTDEPALSTEEIGRLVRAFAGLGFWKIRLTGGEPTARRDIVDIVKLCAGYRKVALSTNGFRLAELAAPLKAAGLKAVNVSIDSLDPARFAEITGMDQLRQVLQGVEAALEAGLETKVNAVLLKDLTGVEDFLAWVRTKPVSVRFIELMQTGENAELFKRRHLSASAIELAGWEEQPRREGDGPARVFRRPGYAGSIGLIAPYSKDFCATCNRLRVTSRGALRLCLFSDGQASLRDLLQDDSQLPELQQRVRNLLSGKEASHRLQEGVTGSAKNLALMGG